MSVRAGTVRSRPVAGLLASLLMAGVATLGVTSPAFACSCAPNPPPDEAREQAAAVFTGTVVATRTVDDSGPASGGMGDLVARVDVEEVFEGEVPVEVEVSTSADDGLCGVGFATGDRWLFYVDHQEDGGFSTHACTRTAALEYAQPDWETSGAAERDLEVLGEPVEPTTGEELREGPLPWVPIVTGALLVVVAAAAVALTWAARRP